MPPPGGLRQLEIGEILDNGFRLWWRTLKQILPYSILLSLPAQLAILAVGLWGNVTQTINSEDIFNQSEEQRKALQASLGSNLVVILIAIIAPLLVQGPLAAYFTDRILNRNTPLKECLPVGLKRLIPLVAIVLVAFPAYVVGACVFCIGIFFPLTRFSVAAPVCVVERAGPIKSISRSWYLTETRFWPTLAIVFFNLLIPGLLGGVVSAVLTLPLRGLGVTAVQLGAFGGRLFTSALLTPLTTAILVVMYLDLRVRREGLDLQLAAQGLTVAQ
jgi:hypothetical protein